MFTPRLHHRFRSIPISVVINHGLDLVINEPHTSDPVPHLPKYSMAMSVHHKPKNPLIVPAVPDVVAQGSTSNTTLSVDISIASKRTTPSSTPIRLTKCPLLAYPIIVPIIISTPSDPILIPLSKSFINPIHSCGSKSLPTNGNKQSSLHSYGTTQITSIPYNSYNPT